MELCHEDVLVLPSNCVTLNDEEMSYLSGGAWSYTYSKNDIAVPIQKRYLSRGVCLGFASYLVIKHGKWGFCNGMNDVRIAAELFSHAVGNYFADALKGIGLKKQWINDLKNCGKVANIGLGDGLDAAYYIVWSCGTI